MGGPRRVEKTPETDFLEVQGGQSAPFCSFKHVDLVDFKGPQICLGALGGALGVSWGLMFGSQDALGILGVHVWPTGGLGEVLGDVFTRLEDARRALDTVFGDPKGSARCKSSYILCVFDDFQKRRVFQRMAPGGLCLFKKTVVFAPWGSLGAPLEACRRALWVPGGSRNHGFVFFWRQGGPPGAAKVCTIANYVYNPSV